MFLTRMKYFVSIVDAGSFSEAAEQHYISQSAISQQIRALEQNLGVELLRREKRSFSLTSAGDLFYQRSVILLDEIERLRYDTVKRGKGTDNNLRLGYLNRYDGKELPNAISIFSEQHPNLSLQIVNGDHESIYTLLRSGSLDVVFSDQRRAFNTDYVNYPITTCNYHVEISVKNPLSSLDRIDVMELKDIPCILLTSEDHKEKEKAFYREVLGIRSDFLPVENLTEARLLVAANRGYFLVEWVGQAPQYHCSTKQVPLLKNGVQIPRTYYAYWKKNGHSKKEEEFACILKKMFSDVQ